MSKILPFPSKSNRFTAFEEDIRRAIHSAAQHYFDDCRAAVPGFIDRHFNYPGAIETNRVALGWDMLLAPANLFWAPFYALICLAKFPLRNSSRFASVYQWLDRVPAGFTTQVQRKIADLIKDNLLYSGYSGRCLDDYIVEGLQGVYEKYSNKAVDRRQFHAMIEPLVDEALSEYQLTRTASTDISNSLSCTIFGTFAFQQFTPGGIGVGILMSSWLSKTLASREFIFGETLGSLYYSVFPPQPSILVLLMALLTVTAMLAALAALSGLIIDPVQAATGIHRRRLHKMLDHLQRDFANTTRSSYRPKDQFVARIMDTFDVIKAGLV